MLEANGYVVRTEARTERVVDRVLSCPPDLLLLDERLDGLAHFQTLQARFHGRAILLAVAHANVAEVAALELGMDDAVGRPVEPLVLLARVRAALRRGADRPAVAVRLGVGPLCLDRTGRTARWGGALVPLTGAEFELLWALAAEAGSPVPRDRLFVAACGVSYDGEDRAVDIHIARLRRKLVDVGAPRSCVLSIRSVGYQWVPGSSSPAEEGPRSEL